MLCSRFLHHESHPRNAFYVTSEKFFNWLNDRYRVTLEFVLRHRRITLLTSLVLTVVTLWLFVVMPKGFMPTVDQGFAFGGTEAAQDTSFDEMVRLQTQVNKIMLKNPYVQSFGSGTGGMGGQNQGFLFAHFKDGKRPNASVLIAQLQQQFAQIPGLMVFMQIPPLITLGQNEGRAQYSLALQDADTNELFKSAPVMEQKLRSIPELQDIFSDLRLQSPRLDVHINRNEAMALGVSPDAVANTLYDAYGNRQVSTITAASDQYEVILEVLPEYQRTPSALKDLYIRSSSGKMVPLSAVSDIVQTVAPLSISHIGQLPAVNFQFDVKPGVSLSEATDLISKAATQIGLPDTVTFSYQGTAAAFESSLKGLGILLIIAVVVIYLVLGVLYESFVHPITILSGLPSAGLGALLTLLMFGEDLNLYSFVGIILLIGIVKKNAIMMIDFAIAAERREGKSAFDAIVEGCLQRFRPIMMTTMAALLGTLPIAFGTGAGGEARRPLGIAVVGGLVVSQLLTLYITPVFYIYLDKLQTWRNKEKSAPRLLVPEQEIIAR